MSSTPVKVIGPKGQGVRLTTVALKQIITAELKRLREELIAKGVLVDPLKEDDHEVP